MSKKENGSASTSFRERPGTTPEAREDQLINMAINLAEEKLRDGTASNQIIVHYLKLGSTKDRLEKEILAEQKKLVEAKTESLQAAKRVDEMYADVISAMKLYSGAVSDEEEEDYEY